MPIPNAELDERVFKQVRLGVRHFYTMWCSIGVTPAGVEDSLERLRRKGRIEFHGAAGGWSVVKTTVQVASKPAPARSSAATCTPMVRVEGMKLSFALDDELDAKPKRKRR